MAKKARALPLLLLSLSFVASLTTVALAECECSADDNAGADKPAALRLKYIAIACILVSSAAGVLIPILGRRWSALSPERNAFFIVKSFAAGVILSTGMVHILPDAFEGLTSPCLPESPWQNFPFAGFVAMMTALGTLVIETLATGYYQRAHFNKVPLVDEEGGRTVGSGGEEAGHLHLHTHATHGHTHGPGPSPQPKEQSAAEHIRHRVVSQVLELGIVVHSVIIGVSMGVSVHPSTVRPLVGALCFHQFFEGMGLGGCIAQAKFKVRATFIMVLFFSLTTPVGIAVGIAITSRYDENSPTALMVEGLLNSAAAGILVYMALVDLLAPDFMNPRMQSNGRLQFVAYVALLVAVGVMSLLAKWA